MGFLFWGSTLYAYFLQHCQKAENDVFVTHEHMTWNSTKELESLDDLKVMLADQEKANKEAIEREKRAGKLQKVRLFSNVIFIEHYR